MQDRNISVSVEYENLFKACPWPNPNPPPPPTMGVPVSRLPKVNMDLPIQKYSTTMKHQGKNTLKANEKY